MKRKHFLSSFIPLAATLGAVAKGKTTLDSDSPVTIPPYLKAGDTIGICCPAGFMKTEEIQPALLKLAEWGFKTKVGATVGKKDFTYGGTDEEQVRNGTLPDGA